MKSWIQVFFLLVFTGCTSSSETNWSFLPSVNGNWEIVNVFGGTQEDIAHGISFTADGGVIIVGNTQSTNGDFSDKNRSGSDIFLMKLNSEFDLEWTQTYGGSDDDRGHGVIQLSDGGYAAIGYSKSDDGDASLNQGQHDNWIIRTDAQGSLLWQKSFGFLGHDHAYNIIATSDGGLFFNGFLDVTASNGEGQDGKHRMGSAKHGVGEFWCHKLDFDGNLQWRRYFGGTSNDRSYDAIQTKEGDFVLAGSSESQDVDISNPKGGYDLWVVKIDSKGNLLWERSVGGSEYDIGKAIIETFSGEYLIAGQSTSQDKDISKFYGGSDGLLVRLSSNGELVQTLNLGDEGFDTLNDLVQRPDGTLVAIGHSGSDQMETVAPNNDVILYYTLANGAILSKHRLGGEGLDLAEAITMNSKGDLIVVGSTESTSGLFSNSKGGKDLFVAVWN